MSAGADFKRQNSDPTSEAGLRTDTHLYRP